MRTHDKNTYSTLSKYGKRDTCNTLATYDKKTRLIHTWQKTLTSHKTQIAKGTCATHWAHMTQRAHTSHWTLTICAIHWAYITQKALIPGLAHIAQRTCATHWAHMTKKATRTDLLSKKTKSIQNTSSTYYSKEHAVYITDYHTKGTSNTLRSYYAERTAIVERIWHQYGRTHWGIITQSLNRIWHKKNVHYIEHLLDKIICHKKYM